jgi:predicted deacylase
MNLFEFLHEKNRSSLLKSKFENLCIRAKCEFKNVGQDSKNNEIFYCKKYFDDKKPYVAILSGLHGNEPAGPEAVYEFFSKHISVSNDDVNLFLMPLLNPHGFNRFIRKDANNTDMNRQWDKNNRKLIKNLKKLFIDENFDLVISLHEDPNVDGFYVYGGRYIKGDQLEAVANILNKFMQPIKDGEIYGDPVFGGMVEDGNEDKPKHKKSLEFFFDKNKIPNVTAEISARGNIESRIQIYRKFIAKILKIL